MSMRMSMLSLPEGRCGCRCRRGCSPLKKVDVAVDVHVDVDVVALPSRFGCRCGRGCSPLKRSMWMSMLSPQEVDADADVDGDVYADTLP